MENFIEHRLDRIDGPNDQIGLGRIGKRDTPFTLERLQAS